MAEALAIEIAKGVTNLTDISGYLQAADEQIALNASVKQWVSQVSDIYFDAEDIVDECAVEHLYTRPTQSCVCRFSQLGFRYKMGKRIKDLKDRMSSTIQKAQELNLVHQIVHSNQPSNGDSERKRAELRRGSKPDPRAVALEDKVEEIERLLEDPAVGVVAVMGMGGLGKTFLLQHLYDKTKYGYELSAWISVSQICSIRSLQSDVAYQINLQVDDSISEVLLSDFIHEKLEEESV
ncbi:hypothetical protein SUGI_0355520 [Cryptomeria japonica]|nr:hypothetical protein SUGI_0355520 [Cryptomeria japonica]